MPREYNENKLLLELSSSATACASVNLENITKTNSYWNLYSLESWYRGSDPREYNENKLLLELGLKVPKCGRLSPREYNENKLLLEPKSKPSSDESTTPREYNENKLLLELYSSTILSASICP